MQIFMPPLRIFWWVTMFFYNKALLNTNCTFNVTLSVQNVRHWPEHMPSAFLWSPWWPWWSAPVAYVDTSHCDCINKMLVLTNISKITSSSARLIDITVTSLLFSWYAVFVLLMKMLQSITQSCVKCTHYKTLGCLCSNGVTYSNVVIIQHNLAVIRSYDSEVAV